MSLGPHSRVKPSDLNSCTSVASTAELPRLLPTIDERVMSVDARGAMGNAGSIARR
jgi:hypothetical protein